VNLPTPGHVDWRLRRDVRRGLRATWHDYFTLNRVADLCLPEPAKGDNVALHIVIGREYWALGLWMLTSFFDATNRSWPVVFHDDGSCDGQVRRAIANVVPFAKIIDRPEADSQLTEMLKPWPVLLKLRSILPLALKLLDAALLGPPGKRLILDCDMMFFRPPTEILEWAMGAERPNYFLTDVKEASAIPPETIEARVGIKPVSKLNSGICAIAADFINPEFLADAMVKTKLLQAERRWTFEQTLFAIAAARQPSELLPSSYLVSIAAHAPPDIIMRHYIGAVRQRFFAEGLARMSTHLMKRFRAGAAEADCRPR
jgi:hypothetical protein